MESDKLTQHKNDSGRTNFIVSVTLLVMLSLLEIFHLLILLRVIPFDYIWGGKLKGTSQMYLFEAISVVINSLMILVTAIHAGLIKSTIPPVIFKVALWLMFLVFMLNTIGNVTSENPFEKNVFTPTTVLLSFLCLIII